MRKWLVGSGVGLVVLVGVSVYVSQTTKVDVQTAVTTQVTVVPPGGGMDEATRTALEEASQRIETEYVPQGRILPLSKID